MTSSACTRAPTSPTHTHTHPSRICNFHSYEKECGMLNTTMRSIQCASIYTHNTLLFALRAYVCVCSVCLGGGGCAIAECATCCTIGMFNRLEHGQVKATRRQLLESFPFPCIDAICVLSSVSIYDIYGVISFVSIGIVYCHVSGMNEMLVEQKHSRERFWLKLNLYLFSATRLEYHIYSLTKL